MHVDLFLAKLYPSIDPCKDYVSVCPWILWAISCTSVSLLLLHSFLQITMSIILFECTCQDDWSVLTSDVWRLTSSLNMTWLIFFFTHSWHLYTYIKKQFWQNKRKQTKNTKKRCPGLDPRCCWRVQFLRCYACLTQVDNKSNQVRACDCSRSMVFRIYIYYRFTCKEDEDRLFFRGNNDTQVVRLWSVDQPDLVGDLIHTVIFSSVVWSRRSNCQQMPCWIHWIPKHHHRADYLVHCWYLSVFDAPQHHSPQDSPGKLGKGSQPDSFHSTTDMCMPKTIECDGWVSMDVPSNSCPCTGSESVSVHKHWCRQCWMYSDHALPTISSFGIWWKMSEWCVNIWDGSVSNSGYWIRHSKWIGYSNIHHMQYSSVSKCVWSQDECLCLLQAIVMSWNWITIRTIVKNL